ncbi:hypothetical protein B0T25DRAFT_467133 [Lasiosphaeria hispida]|uniref:Serine protease n=1 Tax=Lasiosphaeria hispida TaxID=260671 RepID=A0AAJ0H4Y6_9PEZI|nr:hypothetical protein B0T25DRAFT_467133 [Lasiosphaeria hispida]
MSNTTPSNAWTWTLQAPESTQPIESAIVPPGTDKEESVGEPDGRRPVDASDIKDGGKYRSIVKVQAGFRDESGKETWMMGSGWLVDAKTLITAGHVVYDHRYRLGPAFQIRCYIGYNGRDSITNASSDVKVSFGQAVVTTAEWVQSQTRQRDFAIIRVDKDFPGNLRILGYSPTPPSETMGLYLGVVGYPADMFLESKSKIREKGAQMYENFAMVKWNLAKSPIHMVEYLPGDISTYGGQSGAPVILRDTGMTVVGTHCYGVDDEHASNSGNAIGGKYGNEYARYLAVLAGKVESVAEKKGMKLVRLGAASAGGESEAAVEAEGEEGFFDSFGDVFKQIVKVGAAVVPMVGAFTGPVGGVLSSVASSILGKAAETAVIAKTEAVLVGGEKADRSIPEGVLERAVVAEAALQTVLQLDPKSKHAKQVVQSMHKYWEAGAPNIDALSKAMAPVMTECGLDMAVGMIHKLSNRPRTESDIVPSPPRPLRGISSTEASGNPFVDLLLGPTVLVPGEEGAFDTLGLWLSSAATAAQPIVTTAAKKALASVAADIAKKLTSSEGKSSTESEASRQVFQRAVMADAALQTLMAMDKDTLQSLPLNSGTTEEGAFDFLKRAVQTLRPFVGKAAKLAVEKVAPILIDALAPKSEPAKESVNGANGVNGTHKTLKKKADPDSFSSVIDDAIGGLAVSPARPRFQLNAFAVSDVPVDIKGATRTDPRHATVTTAVLTADEKVFLGELGPKVPIKTEDGDPIMSRAPSPIRR